MKARYQDIAEVDPNEDLNIYNNICKMLKYCWYNIDRFPMVEDIGEAMGYSERHITALARQNNLPHRAELARDIKYGYGQKSA